MTGGRMVQDLSEPGAGCGRVRAGAMEYRRGCT
jgi:hypothetical protein